MENGRLLPETHLGPARANVVIQLGIEAQTQEHSADEFATSTRMHVVEAPAPHVVREPRLVAHAHIPTLSPQLQRAVAVTLPRDEVYRSEYLLQ